MFQTGSLWRGLSVPHGLHKSPLQPPVHSRANLQVGPGSPTTFFFELRPLPEGNPPKASPGPFHHHSCEFILYLVRISLVGTCNSCLDIMLCISERSGLFTPAMGFGLFCHLPFALRWAVSSVGCVFVRFKWMRCFVFWKNFAKLSSVILILHLLAVILFSLCALHLTFHMQCLCRNPIFWILDFINGRILKQAEEFCSLQWVQLVFVPLKVSLT